MTGIYRRSLFFVLILGAIFLSQTVMAEETTQKKDRQKAYDLGQVEVSSTRLKEKEPVTSPYAVPESSQLQTEVWTKEEIEALHPQTVWDVLEQVPGMEVTYQGRQHLDFSKMRGTGSYGIILDGVYVTQIDRILATLPVDAIESMTIVRDATALTLGPLTNFGAGTGSSNQGFVVIKTKRASKLEGGLVASYGTFDTEKAHLYQGAKIGNFDYRIAATYNSTDGKNDDEHDDWYNGSDNKSLLFRGGYTVPAFNADLLYYTGRSMREFQRGEIRVPTLKKGKYDWSLVGTLDNAKWKIDPMISDMIAVNLSKPWNDTQTTTFHYAYSRILVDAETASFANSTRGHSDQDCYNQSAGLRHIISWRNNTLKVGGQYLGYRTPQGLATPTGSTPQDERMYSLYVQDEYRMLNDKLTVDAGIRGDRKYYVDSPVKGQPLGEWAEPTYTYGFGASYKPISLLTLTGRYAYSENSLASYQISADGSSLPPEKRSRYEVGILANVHPVFNPWITLFYYNTKDQKVTGSSFTDPATGDEIDYVTAADVRTRGYEAGVSGRILSPFTYRLQYTYVTTNNESTNKSLAHRLASASIGYQYKNAFANASYRYVSAHDLTKTATGIFEYELGDYTRVDANVGYNCKIFDRDTKITIYGRNLGDVHYATMYKTGVYNDPGRQFGVELAYSFF